ncbi:MAG: hypothetical protein R3F49_05485 [Planctomycetota bacterium]
MSEDPANVPRRAPKARIALALSLASVSAFISGLIGVYTFHRYGYSLFALTPFLTGAVFGWSLRRSDPSTTILKALPSLLLLLLATVGLFLITGQEGAICLLLAAPLVTVLSLAGRVLLEGTTWYTHDLTPAWYWGPISDRLIHRIHRRVLDHIATVAAGR